MRAAAGYRPAQRTIPTRSRRGVESLRKSTSGASSGCAGRALDQLLGRLVQLQLRAIQDAVGVADVADLLGA